MHSYKSIYSAVISSIILVLLSISGLQAQVLSQGKKVAHNRPDEDRRFINNVEMKGGGQKVIKHEQEAVSYTEEELAEERSQQTYSIVNITKTMQQINKRSKDLYAMIDSWYGTPYKLGGTTRKAIDCSAFMQTIYNAIYKHQLPRTAKEQFSYSKYIAGKQDLREGDLVFFKIRSKNISHVGIYLADGKFAHASSSKGVIISSLDSKYWAKYYVGGGRVEKAIYAFN